MTAAPKSALLHTCVPYDREAHWRWVKSSWCWSARRSWSALARILQLPGTRCVVAVLPEDADSLLGWAAAVGDALVWVYVRDLHGNVRRRGVGTSLLWHVALDPTHPTPCRYWSPHAADIAAAGAWRIYLDQRTRKEAA